MSAVTYTPVLIVGAGPTGLIVANILARHGIAFRLIERDAGPTDQSRALWVHARTLEYWHKLGVLDAALAQGLTTNRIDILIEGRPKGAIPYQGDGISPFPFGLVLEQSKTQRVLLESLASHGGVVEWRTELIQLQQDDDTVAVTLRGADGQEEQLRATYLVAADGARSFVRRALGLTFEGDTYPQSFFLADVEMAWERGHDQVALNLTKQFVFAFFPMAGPQQFRLIGTVPPEMKDRTTVEAHEVEELINTHSGLQVRILKANWSTIFHSNRRMVNYYTVGRCFLIGDAAHIHTPAGGQGMNLGIGDAFNLGWKLAAVLHGMVHPTLLSSYEAERMPIARDVLNRSDRLFDIQASSHPVLQQVRPWLIPAVAAIASHVGMAREFVFEFLSQIWVSYRDSPVVAEVLETHERLHAAHAGDRAPYATFTTGGSVFDLFVGLNHQLLIFPHALREQAEHITAQAQAILAQYRMPFEVTTIDVEETEVYRQYSITRPTLIMVRPDGHIAYRGPIADRTAFTTYLDQHYTRHAAVSS